MSTCELSKAVADVQLEFGEDLVLWWAEAAKAGWVGSSLACSAGSLMLHSISSSML